MKTKLIYFFGILAIFFASASATSISFAQQNPTEKSASTHQGWYQVEMIVFSRNNPNLQEHFPNNIQLKYPSRWEALKNPNPPAIADTSVVESTEASPDSDLNTEITPNTQITELPVVDFNTQPFYQLPAEFRQLNNEANKFSRSSEYTLLFHHAWRQAITTKNQAEWILINNSRTDTQSPLLSGSIRLSVATYLRLDTRLWFAEFEPKTESSVIDGEQPLWPEIPESPDLISTDITDPNADINTASTDMADNFSQDESASMPTQEWQTKRIILLNEKVDMRSNELHYVDHPLVGIIVKISPFVAPTLNTEE